MPAEMRCRVGDRSVAIRVAGPADGRSVLFFAGTPNSRVIGPSDAVAHATGARVISFDRPGYGRSDWVEQLSYADAASNVLDLLAFLAIDTVSIVAWSAGAGHAMATAVQLGGRCESIRLIAPVGPNELAGCRKAQPRLARAQLAALRRLPMGARRRGIEKALSAGAEQANQNAETRWRTIYDRAGKVDRAVLDRPDIAAIVREDIVESFAEEGDGWFEDAYLLTTDWPAGTLELPHVVEIWHGDADDEIALSSGRALAARLPNAQLHEVTGGGHYTLFDHWPQLLEATTEAPAG